MMRRLCLALLIIIGVACAQEPVAIGDSEVWDHRLSSPKAIHSDAKSAFPALDSIRLQVITDANGSVESAKAFDGPKEFFDAAESLELKQIFKPFERDGVAVKASFLDYISIVPPEKWADVGVPFPEVKSWDSLVMRLKRTGCYGPCPAYTVAVHGDGAVEFEGSSNVLIGGHHTSRITTESVQALLTAFRKANYFSLRDKYVATITDNPTYTTSIEFDGTSKSVRDYVGLRVGMPEVVKELEDTVDRIAATKKWVKGNEETAPALLAENYDFKADTDADRALFARVTAQGSDDLIRLFMARGAPALTMTESGESALVSAAERGDFALVKLLLDKQAAPPAAVVTCALGAAARNGDLPLVRFLIEKGAQPNGSLCGRLKSTTVLMQAAGSSKPEVVEEILKYHPALEAKDLNGATALHHVFQHSLVSSYDLRSLNLLLAAGADVNSRNSNQQTPLFGACTDNDSEVIRVLANAGADLNAKDQNGQTALMSCFATEPLNALIEAGADLTIVNDQGHTAAQEARETGMLKKAELLESAMKRKPN